MSRFYEAAGTSAGFVTEDYDVFLNHRGPDVKSTFVTHLEDALRSEGFRPFLDVRFLMVGGPALKSIDQALDMAKVHVAVVSKGYAEPKYCLSELVDMLKSCQPVVPVLYDVEPRICGAWTPGRSLRLSRNTGRDATSIRCKSGETLSVRL
uniref:ADP-ribosyl cyclase/cyclic ADP-ribose hydrolase n=1 Tax=Physcomitrium patens TaxID=3218 RepID=A0A2K1KG87_PHYPA|nr:hypothetical protein PHYPA_009172 [Physcomitrium patens]